MKYLALLVLLLAVLFTALACADAQSWKNAGALRRKARADREGLAAATAASRQAEAGKPVGADDLVRMLSGHTHVSEYRRQPHDAKPHFTQYDYFDPDGSYLVLDTYSRREIKYQSRERWRISQDMLCIKDRAQSMVASCGPGCRRRSMSPPRLRIRLKRTSNASSRGAQPVP